MIEALEISAGDAFGFAVDLINDPDLPRIVSLAKEVIEIETSKPSAPGPKPVGIGLKRFVFPLELYVDVRRHPWKLYAAIAGAVALPFAVGYLVGRKRSHG